MIHLHKLFLATTNQNVLGGKNKKTMVSWEQYISSWWAQGWIGALLQPVEKGKLNFEAEEWIQ